MVVMLTVTHEICFFFTQDGTPRSDPEVLLILHTGSYYFIIPAAP
jgi:hypothetical protein